MRYLILIENFAPTGLPIFAKSSNPSMSPLVGEQFGGASGRNIGSTGRGNTGITVPYTSKPSLRHRFIPRPI